MESEGPAMALDKLTMAALDVVGDGRPRTDAVEAALPPRSTGAEGKMAGP